MATTDRKVLARTVIAKGPEEMLDISRKFGKEFLQIAQQTSLRPHWLVQSHENLQQLRDSWYSLTNGRYSSARLVHIGYGANLYCYYPTGSFERIDVLPDIWLAVIEQFSEEQREKLALIRVFHELCTIAKYEESLQISYEELGIHPGERPSLYPVFAKIDLFE